MLTKQSQEIATPVCGRLAMMEKEGGFRKAKLLLRDTRIIMLLFITATLVFLTDWLSKLYIQKNLPLGNSIPLIKDFFYITFIKNEGIIFGLFSGRIFFIILFNGLLIFLLVLIMKEISRKSRGLKVSLGLLWGGLIANFFDRVLDGRVTDFLYFRFLPVFNLADIAILVGTGFFIWKIISIIKREKTHF